MSSILRTRPLAIAGLLLFLVAAGPAAGERYDDYHQLSEVESQLAAWAGEHPQLIQLLTAGKSAGGHPIRIARLAAPGALDPETRPAVFVGANVAGYHNAGTEAALDLIATLIAMAGGEGAELLSTVTFYVAPVLHPDAHDGLFATVRVRQDGNAMLLDRDRDGFVAEDDFDDLNGDGRITQMRIADPRGPWLPHPEEPRLMVRQDAAKGWVGSFRLLSEGRDDDGDGEHNEDPAGGVVVDNNFPHEFPYPEPQAGPWPSYAPEAKAILDFLFARRHVAVAVVYGPANNLLAMPESLGGGGDLGTQKFKLPEFAAEMLGFDPEEEYSIDEVWEVAKDLPFIRQHNVTKEMLAQFVGAGPATKVADEDLKVLERLAKDYKERLEKAGLDQDRPGKQYARGGMTPWFYYQYCALALELDVWGVPKAREEEKKDAESAAEGEAEEAPQALTVERLEQMSVDEFLELDEETVAAFLKEIKAPPQFTAARLIERVKGGQMTPKVVARMARQRGGGGDDEEDQETRRQREILVWLEANDREGFAPWTEVTLADGTRAEVGGFDPFLELAPAMGLLEPAIRVHTATVLDLAARVARVGIVSLEVKDLGAGVYRVEAVAANRGELATHTQMAVRARSWLPVRLELETGDGVELVTGQRATTSERLEGRTGTLEGQWLVRARPGAEITVRVQSETAGRDQKTVTVPRGK